MEEVPLTQDAIRLRFGFAVWMRGIDYAPPILLVYVLAVTFFSTFLYSPIVLNCDFDD